MSCIGQTLKEHFRQEILDNPGASNVEQAMMYSIKKNDNDKMVTDFLKEQFGDGSTEIYYGSRGNKSFKGQLESFSIDDNGMLNVRVKKADGKGYVTVSELSLEDGIGIFGNTGKKVRIPSARLLSRPTAASAFNEPMTQASMAANRYVSHMLISMGTEGKGYLAPHIKKWHKLAKQKSSLYREAVNLIASGFGNPELLEEIKAYLQLTGDIDRKNLAKITTAAEQIQRRNNDILTKNLPKLDKRIEAEVRDKKVREHMDDVFGRSGFGVLFDNKDVLEKLENGADIDSIINDMKATDSEIRQAKRLSKYYMDGIVDRNMQNANGDTKVEILAVLEALKEDGRYKSFKWLYNNKPELYVEVRNLAGTVYELNKVVNRGAVHPVYGKGADVLYTGYDGHGTLDVFDESKEFKVVEEGDGYINKYLGENSPWQVLREPTKDRAGIIYKTSGETFINGMGVNENRISNGIMLSRKFVEDRLKENPDWLKHNNVVWDDDNGYPRYRMILKRKEFDKAEGKRDVAHRLMRAYAHNKELIEVGTVRKEILNSMVYKADGVLLDDLEKVIARNDKVSAEGKKVIKPFLNTKMSEEDVKKNYPNIAKKYKRVENLSNYGKFDKEITYVRRDMEAMVVGHSQKLVVSDDWPRLQEWERYYKQMVQLLKLKLVVAAPAKLGTDILSNAGMLMTMDIGVDEVYKYSKDAIVYSNEMGKLEGNLVQAKLELAEAELLKDEDKIESAKKVVDKVQKEMEDHPYYDAIKFGFVQSMATSMLLQEFDTVSGLQNTMDKLVGKLMENGEGNKTEIHKAISWWMNAGYGVNDILDAVTNISKLKGTSFNEELIGISDRLKDKKQRDDTVGYVNEFLASPGSEIVRQGSRIMQLGDAMGRWTLYQSRLKDRLAKYKKENGKKASGDVLEGIKEDVSIEALDTFIDYRLNMPAKMRALSDYGVLMFPSFWARAQKIIYNLAKYHPLNAGGGYLVADLLGMNGASILDANVGTKFVEGTLVHPGQDVLDVKTFVLGF